MKAKSIFLTVICLITHIAAAQPYFMWGKKVGRAAYNEFSGAITADDNGDVWVAGNFTNNNLDLDPSSGTAYVSAVGSYDGFLAKYDASGVYQWGFAIGGSAYDGINAITSDDNGNIYVTGFFRSAVIDFNPSITDTANIYLTTNSNQDLFLAKYSSTGTFKWAFGLGAGSSFSDYATGNSLASDDNENIYLAGTFNFTLDADPSAAVANLSTFGNYDGLVAKYDSSGNYQWAFQLGSNSGHDFAYGIKLDGYDNVWVTGIFLGTVDFNPGAGAANLISNGAFDVYVGRYNFSMGYEAAFRFGGTSSEYSRGICLDGNSNIHISGEFEGTTDLDPSAGSANFTSAGNADFFISKYDSSGNYSWGYGAGSTNWEMAGGIDISTSGIVFMSGAFYGTVDFDPGSGTSNLTASDKDGFIAEYSSSGSLVTAFPISSSGTDEGTWLDINASDYLYITGELAGTADFDPGSGVQNISSSGGTDVYFVKYSIENPLPVELLALTAVMNAGVVKLSWETATEINNEYYLVQRSKDGIVFENTGRVDGMGTVNYASSYAWYDPAPLEGVSYYRLQQFDFDGTSVLSKAVAVKAIAVPAYHVYPNPFSRRLAILKEGSPDEAVSISLTNMAGQKVFEKPAVVIDSVFTINNLSLPAGEYILQIGTGYSQRVSAQ